MARKPDKVGGSRLHRLTRVGWLSRRALPVAWQRLREAGDATGPEARAQVARDVLDKHADIAEEAFATLGDMKGLALKVGQMLSYMDGALPEAYREVYQEVLGRLQQTAPGMSWESVEPVLTRELGGPVAEFFLELEPEPFAAASIGQVHRGVTRGGEEVAVKIQYPGVDQAITADLDNAGMLRTFMAPLLGLSRRGHVGDYLGEIMEEVRARILEELDYEHEAVMQERFRLNFSGDPDIRVPKVFRELSRRRVLTSELMAGRTLAQVVAEEDQAARDRYGTILVRSLVQSLHTHRLFNADPHPGNYLFPEDGSVVFLDYGCVKEIPKWMAQGVEDYVSWGIRLERTGSAEDAAGFDAAVRRALRLQDADPLVARVYQEFLLYCLQPMLRDHPFEFTTEYSGKSIDQVIDGAKEVVFAGGKLPKIPDIPPVPADYTFLNRLQWGFYSILTQLGARVNWHRELPERVRR